MSYSIFAKFFVGNKERGEGAIDQLKSLCEQRYSADFEDIDPTSDSSLPDYDGYYESRTFFNYLKPEYVKELKNAKKIKYENAYLLSEEDANAIPENYFYSTSEVFGKDAEKVWIYTSGIGHHKGKWYDSSCFSKALVGYESKYNEFKEKALKLKLLKESIEYYKLDEDAKQSLDDDIEYNNDMAGEYDYKIFACNKMLNLFEFLNDDYCGEDWNINDKCYAYIYAE